MINQHTEILYGREKLSEGEEIFWVHSIFLQGVMKLAGLYTHRTQCSSTGEVKYYLFTFLLIQLLAQREVLCLIYNRVRRGWWLQANDRSELLTQPAPTSHRTSAVSLNYSSSSRPCWEGVPRCWAVCKRLDKSHFWGWIFQRAACTQSLLFSECSKWGSCLLSGGDLSRSPWSKDKYLYI